VSPRKASEFRKNQANLKKKEDDRMLAKSLGVIGGMGPKATSVFFDKVVENTVAHKDQDHIDMIILNHASLPDRTTAILTDREEEFLQAVSRDFKLLEHAEVSNIAIPCNTSHYFYDKMQAMTNINIINMVEETIKEIHAVYGENSKIGILATKGTIRTGIYEQWCNQYNMQLHLPTELQQEQVMDIIYNNVKGDLDVDPTELESMIHDLVFEENCSCVILACTELSCIKLSDDAERYAVDAMGVLVEKSIELSGKSSKTAEKKALTTIGQ
jgi:aspartate racemase